MLTNGAFDLVHVGHIRYLEAAARLGEVLIVGVNDDASVRRLKGPERPLNPAEERAEVIAALQMVDHVVIFSGDTAVELVDALHPQVYVKGGDYSPDPLDSHHPPEGSQVRANGGSVHIIDFVPDHSTTALVTRMQATLP